MVRIQSPVIEMIPADSTSLTVSSMHVAGMWLLRREYAGEASCAADVTCRSGVPGHAGWRQPGNRHDVTA